MTKRKRALKLTQESTKRKHEGTLAREKKSLKDLLEQKNKLAGQVAEKVENLREKSTVVSDLIERAKVNADRATTEILLKWEASNENSLQTILRSQDKLQALGDPHQAGRRLVQSIDQLLSRKKNLEEVVRANDSRNEGPAETRLQNYRSAAELQKRGDGSRDRPVIKKDSSQSALGPKLPGLRKPPRSKRDDEDDRRRRRHEEEAAAEEAERLAAA